MRSHFHASAVLLLTLAAAAEGQLASPARQCIDAYNNKLRLVSQQAGKSARACLRAAAKGTESNPDNCLLADADGKIANKEAKVAALYSGGKCDGGEPIQQGAAIGNAAHRGAVTDLVHDLFGDPVTTAVVGLDVTDGRCVDAAMKRGVQAFAAIVKAHRQCKKSGLQSGAVTDAATLDGTCGTLMQVDSSGKAQQRLIKLVDDVGAACTTSSAGLGALFPGLAGVCHGSGAALAGCVAARTSCRACLALNEADGQHIDCDLFDDATDNDSCFAFDLGSSTCTFTSDSKLVITNSALPLTITPSGSMSISCGTTDAAQATACTCSLNSFGAVVLPAIGDVCIAPAAGCSAGGIDCDGGPGRDVDLRGDHNIGACTSQAGCAAACDSHCSGFGAGYLRRASGCEGYCQGGTNDESACVENSDCPGADCVGAGSGSHNGICNCVCEATDLNAPGGAGELACNVGFQLHIELPSDGDCLDSATETVPPYCLGLTTATSSGQSIHSDNMPFILPPGSYGTPATGTSLDCGTIETSGLGGMKLVGNTVLFDSTLGDNFVRFTLVCQ